MLDDLSYNGYKLSVFKNNHGKIEKRNNSYIKGTSTGT